MKTVRITKGRASLYFDSATGYIRIEMGGGFVGLKLDPDELLDLAAAVLTCRRRLRRA